MRSASRPSGSFGYVSKTNDQVLSAQLVVLLVDEGLALLEEGLLGRSKQLLRDLVRLLVAAEQPEKKRIGKVSAAANANTRAAPGRRDASATPTRRLAAPDLPVNPSLLLAAPRRAALASRRAASVGSPVNSGAGDENFRAGRHEDAGVARVRPLHRPRSQSGRPAAEASRAKAPTLAIESGRNGCPPAPGSTDMTTA